MKMENLSLGLLIAKWPNKLKTPERSVYEHYELKCSFLTETLQSEKVVYKNSCNCAFRKI